MNEIVADALEGRYRQVGAVLGLRAKTEPMVWRVLVQYSRIFIEYPLLREVGREAAARIQARRDPVLDRQIEYNHAVDRTKAAVASAVAACAVPLSADEVRLITELVKEGPWGEPPAAESVARAVGLVLHATEGADHPEMAQALARLGACKRAMEEAEAGDRFLAVVEPWRLWEQIGLLGSLPENMALNDDNFISYMASHGLRRKLGLPSPLNETAERALPDLDDLSFRLPMFQAWVLSAVRSRRVRGDSLRRYKHAAEVFRFEELATRARGLPRPKDEHALRDDLGLFLLHEGFRIFVEPLQGRARPDLVAEFNSETDLAVEVKVVRGDDEPAPAKARLAKGVRQALHYARKNELPEAFLVVFWDSDIQESIARDYVVSDCVVRLVVVHLRGRPSEGTRTPRLSVDSWGPVVAALGPSDAAEE